MTLFDLMLFIVAGLWIAWLAIILYRAASAPEVLQPYDERYIAKQRTIIHNMKRKGESCR